ncbi:MAG: elongation factor P [Acidimicrobiales bacterium]|mgnify:CR=1 FL=1|jgi:elongation factor P|nr:elongation factor P [Acidimicrobiales bacterium]MDP7542514.1 elongation factor P [Acidimicrobiales bacterium]|tara:strand:+ start:2852 stop:3415 length:564 start_codon:yes stop_codon:yes gene_type:complete
MATITTNDLKNGMALELGDGLFTVVEFQHVKPGKGHAFVRTTLRNARTGSSVDRTFRAGEKVERAMIDKRSMQYLYRDGPDFVFMDNETYEQISIPPEALGPAVDYLVDGSAPIMQMYGTEVIGVELPAAVELVITVTEPGLAGDRVSGARKPATLETGLIVQVPLFIEQGETIKVDTRSGEYLSRG